MTLFVSAAEAVPKNANESRAKQTDRTNGFVFMVSSSRELNVASMLFVGRGQRPTLNVQRPTSNSEVILFLLMLELRFSMQYPALELVLTPNGISAGIAA
jgi:hypothetical protein